MQHSTSPMSQGDAMQPLSHPVSPDDAPEQRPVVLDRHESQGRQGLMQRCGVDQGAPGWAALAHAADHAQPHGCQALQGMEAQSYVTPICEVRRRVMGKIETTLYRLRGRKMIRGVSTCLHRDSTHLVVLGEPVQGIGHEDSQQRLTGLRPAPACTKQQADQSRHVAGSASYRHKRALPPVEGEMRYATMACPLTWSGL